MASVIRTAIRSGSLVILFGGVMLRNNLLLIAGCVATAIFMEFDFSDVWWIPESKLVEEQPVSAPKPELRLTGDSEECPYCHANLVAGPIPEDQRENYVEVVR